MIPDAHGCKTPGNRVAVSPVTIADEVVGRFVPWEGLGELVGDPFRRRIGRHREQDQPPALMPENDQDEEQLETNRRHDQEIHGGDAGHMVVQECLPGLRLPFAMYLATVDCPTSIPSFSSSPWMRGAPHSYSARLISRIRRRISSGTFGRPPPFSERCPTSVGVIRRR